MIRQALALVVHAVCLAIPAAAVADDPTAAANFGSRSQAGASEPGRTTRWDADLRRAAPGPADDRIPLIVRTGLEPPCPPLPRLGPGAACRCGAGLIHGGRCDPDRCVDSPCSSPGCVPCIAPAPPVVGPYLVCDGGDAGRPARAVGADRLANLTAGDTVARYRPADDGPDATAVRLSASNCACVYAPRFGSVREIVRPLEKAAPLGPRGLALGTGPDEHTHGQPVCGSTQNLAAVSARKALPGVAVQERIAPLAVDHEDVPNEDRAAVAPAERITDDQPELTRLAQRPFVAVGFDVPTAWTCVKAANVLVDGRSAEAVSVGHGTATLRFEEPGRAELTLCKQAGTDTARTGEELDFTIFMLNSGDRPLRDIVLVDALPTRLRLVPDSAASSIPADFSTDRGDDGSVVLTWRLRETLPPGGSGFVRFRTLVR